MKKRLIAVVLATTVVPVAYAGCSWWLSCFSSSGGCTASGSCPNGATLGTQQSECYTNTALGTCCICVYRVDICNGGGTRRVIVGQWEVSNSSCNVVPPSDHCGRTCMGWSPPGGSN